MTLVKGQQEARVILVYTRQRVKMKKVRVQRVVLPTRILGWVLM